MPNPTEPQDLSHLLEQGESSSPRDHELLANLRQLLPELRELVEWLDGGEEDGIYRFWHYSFKVYGLQDDTERIVELLDRARPEGTTLNPWFRTIVAQGTGKRWTRDHNDRWLEETRPIVEAWFHAAYFARMALRYADLEYAPRWMPSGWAALLELYGIR